MAFEKIKTYWQGVGDFLSQVASLGIVFLELAAGEAMPVHCRACRRKRLHGPGQEAAEYSREDIAGSAHGKIAAGKGGETKRLLRGADDGPRAFQDDRAAGLLNNALDRLGSRCLNFRSAAPAETGHFTWMRGEDGLRGKPVEDLRFSGQGEQGIRIINSRFGLGLDKRMDKFDRLRIAPHSRSNDQGIGCLESLLERVEHLPGPAAP